MDFQSKDSKFGFAMFVVWVYYAFFWMFCVASQRERERERGRDQTFMLERRTGDLRNDVGLSPGGIVRHVDLEIGSFTGDISLYFAFTAVAEAVDAIVSLFWVGSSGGTSVFFLLCVVLLLLL